MSKINDGGPAFPRPMAGIGNQSEYDREVECGHPGMSVRTWLAGKAMAAMVGLFWERHQRLPEARSGGIVQTTVQLPDETICTEDRGGEDDGVMDDAIAISACRLADALIAELERKGKA